MAAIPAPYVFVPVIGVQADRLDAANAAYQQEADLSSEGALPANYQTSMIVVESSDCFEDW